MSETTNSHRCCPQAAMRYGRVLYELGIQEDTIDKTREIFCQVPQLYEVFVNPTIHEAEKRKVIDQIFPAKMGNFLKVTCRYQRMDLIQDIFMAYDMYRDAQKGVLRAELTCAKPPSEEQLDQIKVFLCSKYSVKQADVQIIQDKSLLDGFVLLAGNDEYDWSLKGRLHRLEQKLTGR